MNSTIKKLNNHKANVLKKANINVPEEITHANEITSSITKLIQEIEKIRFKKNQITSKANWCLKVELINKFWCTICKEKKGRDTIMELHTTNSPEISYTSNSQEMANEMATYHQNIQAHDIDPPGPTRNDTIKEMLINIPCLNTKDNLSLDNELSYAEIEHAIKCSPNDKAPSLNGIPTEIYKSLHKCHIKK